mmetsp:Transcript_12601/g.27865  ORF Transcript_12601/g.27865 Transcript_12601/m.27865 type:complete len:117 (-) Transcript_12601:144-494(-)
MSNNPFSLSSRETQHPSGSGIAGILAPSTAPASSGNNGSNVAPSPFASTMSGVIPDATPDMVLAKGEGATLLPLLPEDAGAVEGASMPAIPLPEGCCVSLDDNENGLLLIVYVTFV